MQAALLNAIAEDVLIRVNARASHAVFVVAMIGFAPNSRLIAETDKLIEDARVQVAQLQAALQGCSGESPVRSRLLSELAAIQERLGRLQMLRGLVIGQATDLDMCADRTQLH